MRIFFYIVIISFTIINNLSCDVNRTSSSQGLTMSINLDERGVLLSKDTLYKVKKILNPGSHSLSKDDTVMIFNILVNQDTMKDISFINKDKKLSTISIYYRFKPIEDEIDSLYIKYGRNYNEYIVKPLLKKITSEYFSERRDISPNDFIDDSNIIYARARDSLSYKHIFLDYLSIQND